MIRIGAVVVALLATGLIPSAAIADTIYLTNGRVIHAATTRVEGDRVVFSQFGGEVSIPLAAVVRIVEDERVEQTSEATSSGAEEEARASEASSVAEEEARAGRATGNALSNRATGREAPPPADDMEPAGNTERPWQTAPYWVERILEVDARIERARGELDKLPSYGVAERRLLRADGQSRYFMAQRARWQGLLAEFEQTRRELFDGARRNGITPGELRDGLRR